MQGIAFPLTPGMQHLQIVHLQEAMVFLGFSIADSERGQQRYGRTTRAAVAALQRQQNLSASGEVDQLTAGAINDLLDQRGVLDLEVPDLPGPGDPDIPGIPVPVGRQVLGTVLHTDGTAVSGLLVHAFHRRLGGELGLGNESLTDSRGQYLIPYELPPGISRIDLFVRASDNQVIVAVSAIVIDAGGQETLDLEVVDPKYRGPSEFERVSRALQPQLGGLRPERVDADDVALLVRSTGIRRVLVTAWMAAGRLADRTALDHETFYGLVRSQNSALLPRLLRNSAGRLVRMLIEAADANIISHLAGQRAEETVKELRRLAVTLSTSRETPGSLGLLLATGGASSTAQQTAFIERYANHEGPVRTLWRSMRNEPDFGDAVVNDLQLSLRLGTLTANHVPLVQALRDRGITHAAQTAALDITDWRQLLTTRVDGVPVGTPPQIKGETAADRRDNYVRLLTERTARAFPTAHVAKSLKRLPEWRSSTAVSFLDKNLDFNLLTANVKSSLAAPAVAIEPDWDRSVLETELATVQRVARVATVGQEESVVSALLSNGYTSALSIARQSRTTFRRKTAASLSDQKTADAVYRQAQFQLSRAAGAYGLMDPTIAGGMVGAIGTVSSEVANDPTWASLFGNADYCRCDHCRSIYSPAAYFADLLGWLDGHEAGSGTAFEILNARRPDLQRIELSCENTNTVLPYVDLVNEILEIKILNPSGQRPNAPQVPAATTATSTEVLADPEHLNSAAYDDHLGRQIFPHTLPFNLWGSLGRVYFEHLGVARSDLMEALGKRPGSDEIDSERLELSQLEWRILTGAARHEVWEYWGYAESSSDGTDYKLDLAVVSTLLTRAGLEYETLLDLLHCRFVHPGGVRILGAESNTDEMTITPITDEIVDRMHLFLRLWRNRGWTMLDLDKTLRALGIDTLDDASLRRLADLDRLRALTDAGLLELLCWWAPIDTAPDRPEKDQPVKSLYERTFLNLAVDATADQPEFPLALNFTRTELANSVTWEDVRSLLQAALMVDATDLATILDETVDGLPNPDRVVTGTTATLEGLSALYRHVTAARQLHLTLSELLVLLRLTGIQPFDLAHTETSVRLVETAQEIQDSEFSLLELQYLLEHDPIAETSLGVTDEAIAQILVEIRDGLTRVAEDYSAIADPAGETTARYLAVLLTADQVAAVMVALQTEAVDAAGAAELEAVLTEHLSPLFSFDARALIKLPVEQRFDALVKRLAPYLEIAQADALIIEKIAGFAGRGLDSTADLLRLRLQMKVDGAPVSGLAGLRLGVYTNTTATDLVVADDPEAFAALRRVHKVSMVLTKLSVELDAQVWLFDIGARNGLLNPLALPVEFQPLDPSQWEAWTRLVNLAGLALDLPGGEPTLVELLQLLDSSEPAAAAEETFVTELAARTGWLVEDLQELIGIFRPAFPSDWRDGRVLRQLVEAQQLLGRLGASAAQAKRWAEESIGADIADELRLAAKSKHDEERWPAIARALRDPVREQQRAALVTYLIATNEKYADEEALFTDLLIDVEMAPCMLTSRIKQAISSAQLFIQRAFLNVEDDVELSRDDRDQWEWMKNYRVWEAARKVFLYPENWIEPELRINKSPLFEQLEDTLLQGELDEVAAERAYTAYLEGLQKVARMEVMGLYHQFETDDEGTVDLLHVVARTKTQPYEYYYRQWIDRREWTPWEELDADIEGDHVILAVQDRRLFLFWPTVVQKAAAEEVDAQDRPIQTDFYEMKLSWLERMHGQWGARKMSDQFLTVTGTWERDQATTYFRLEENDKLVIGCRQAVSPLIPPVDLLGTFELNPSSGNFGVNGTPSESTLVAPANNFVHRMRFRALSSFAADAPPVPMQLMSGSVEDGRLIGEAEALTLIKMDSASTIAYPHQYGEYASQHSAFFDDTERTFHVMPEPAFVWETVSEPDEVEPSGVGTTDSGTDVLIPEEEDTFEPELPWEKTQEPPLTSSKNRAAGQRAAVVADTGGAFLDLTSGELQLSHNQLQNSGLEVDTMVLSDTHSYRFALFHHPYVGDFMTELRRAGVPGLLDPDPDGSAAALVRQEKSDDFFYDTHLPTPSVLSPYPIQNIDFEFGGAYTTYNWELFFHTPMLIASRLSTNQRFEDARRWFHFMFDPTNPSPEADPLRFWKIYPFHRLPDAPIEAFLALAASLESSPEIEKARHDYDLQIAAALSDPFNPHRIAELRTTAYQKTLVMKYLDNLLAWGDQLFRQDTIESLNEATQLYALALQLLGPRPDALAPRRVAVVTTFEQVRADLAGSVLNNPLVQLENAIFLPTVHGTSSALSPVANPWITSMFPKPQDTSDSAGFYFCIPPNDKLLAYYDTVDDRLFKIRNCMNIEGVVRQLPLFEPPIDPGMLVRARAAGIDLSSALSDLSAPLPHYRFTIMLQKTYSLNSTVRSLGNALLSALEKHDVETLAMLRADQEVSVLEAMQELKKLAIDEAKHSLAAAESSLAVVEQRRSYYEDLIAAGLLAEEKQQETNLHRVRDFSVTASTLAAVGSGLSQIPAIVTGVTGTFGTPTATVEVVAGDRLAMSLDLLSQAAGATASYFSSVASVQAVAASFSRRGQEWNQQLEAATGEIGQIEKQIEAAQIRVALAERDKETHDRQIENARSVREFMEQKFTNAELYQWMIGQLSTLYFQSYQLAYDLAKQTERAYRHELGLPEATFVQFGYWDSLKKGLLAGERLQYDLERMEKGYLDNDSREYEITRHVSLALLDPVALMQLRTAGACEFSIPEAHFDLDYPGQYMRRIKSVSVTVPCVTGPFTAVPMRLTLVSSRIRVDPSADGDYPIDLTAEDLRFQTQTGAVQSITLSTGREDSGLFVMDHRDERYLPFERSGVISDWNLTLTSAVPTFDWNTITDLVLHLRYTARDGGEQLQAAALTSLNDELANLPLRRSFSSRNEFASAWNAFLRPAEGLPAVLTVELGEQLFPRLAQGADPKITNLELLTLVKDPAGWPGANVTVTSGSNVQTAPLVSSTALYDGQPSATVDYGGADLGTWVIEIPTDQLGAPMEWIDDLILIVTYQLDLPID